MSATASRKDTDKTYTILLSKRAGTSGTPFSEWGPAVWVEEGHSEFSLFVEIARRAARWPGKTMLITNKNYSAKDRLLQAANSIPGFESAIEAADGMLGFVHYNLHNEVGAPETFVVNQAKKLRGYSQIYVWPAALMGVERDGANLDEVVQQLAIACFGSPLTLPTHKVKLVSIGS